MKTTEEINQAALKLLADELDYLFCGSFDGEKIPRQELLLALGNINGILNLQDWLTREHKDEGTKDGENLF